MVLLIEQQIDESTIQSTLIHPDRWTVDSLQFDCQALKLSNNQFLNQGQVDINDRPIAYVAQGESSIAVYRQPSNTSDEQARNHVQLLGSAEATTCLIVTARYRSLNQSSNESFTTALCAHLDCVESIGYQCDTPTDPPIKPSLPGETFSEQLDRLICSIGDPDAVIDLYLAGSYDINQSSQNPNRDHDWRLISDAVLRAVDSKASRFALRLFCVGPINTISSTIDQSSRNVVLPCVTSLFVDLTNRLDQPVVLAYAQLHLSSRGPWLPLRSVLTSNLSSNQSINQPVKLSTVYQSNDKFIIKPFIFNYCFPFEKYDLYRFFRSIRQSNNQLMNQSINQSNDQSNQHSIHPALKAKLLSMFSTSPEAESDNFLFDLEHKYRLVDQLIDRWDWWNEFENGEGSDEGSVLLLQTTKQSSDQPSNQSNDQSNNLIRRCDVTWVRSNDPNTPNLWMPFNRDSLD